MDYLGKTKGKRLNNILFALQYRCSYDTHQSISPPHERWSKTHDATKYCESGIYIIRYHLIKALKRGRIAVTSKSFSNSLRWYIAAMLILPKQHTPRELQLTIPGERSLYFSLYALNNWHHIKAANQRIPMRSRLKHDGWV